MDQGEVKPKRGAQPGNQNSAKDRRVRKELIAILDEEPGRLREVCLQLIAKAMMGDVAAFKELRDTIDGKPKQAMELSGDAESPLTIVWPLPRTPLDR